MKHCSSGRVITKSRGGQKFYFIRLNIKDNDAIGAKKYTTKDIPTDLPATKRNFSKANALLDEAITSYSGEASNMFFHRYLSDWLEKKSLPWKSSALKDTTIV